MIHQQSHVIALAPEASKLIGESFDRHVGDGEQVIELDAEAITQLLAIAGLQLGLRGRQKRANRVVHQIEDEL